MRLSVPLLALIFAASSALAQQQQKAGPSSAPILMDPTVLPSEFSALSVPAENPAPLDDVRMLTLRRCVKFDQPSRDEFGASWRRVESQKDAVSGARVRSGASDLALLKYFGELKASLDPKAKVGELKAKKGIKPLHGSRGSGESRASDEWPRSQRAL